MKHIIIEGCDRTSKSTLVEGLCKHYKFDNIITRHFSKPPKNYDRNFPLDWQMSSFVQEFLLLNQIKENEEQEFRYYENKIIWNRSPLGEIVWSPLYRKGNIEEIKRLLSYYENQFLNDKYLKNTYLVYLYADAEFLNNIEDGNSFSNTVEQKQKELDAFEEAIEFSIIPNKLKLKVCDENQHFYTKQYVLDQVLIFINKT